nr:PAC2 family protein [Candidatus Njordarchaeum guaymaensis]
MMVIPAGLKEGAEIVQTKKVTLNKPIVIVGFPGPGLIGTIVTHHLIQMMNMELIGTIRSPFVPAISPFYSGVLRAPIRVYASNDGTVVTVISEVALPTISLSYFAYAISEWAENNGATELICVDGLAKKEERKKVVVYGAAEPEVLKELMEHDIARLPVGFIAGLPGAIMNECLMRELKGLCLLVEAIEDVPDPEAAAEVIKSLSKIRGVSADVKPLLDEARNIKKQLGDLAVHTGKVKEQERRNSPVPIYT